MFETLKYEMKDGIAYVTISRPKAMNALSAEVLGELKTVFEQIADDPEAQIVILTVSYTHLPYRNGI